MVFLCFLEQIRRNFFLSEFGAELFAGPYISFHLNDKNPEALVDIDLKRLQFVNQHLVLPDKQELYLAALENLEQKTIQSPISTIVTYNIAQVWVQKGASYKPLQSDDHKWDLKKAYEICETAMRRFPNSEEIALAYNLQVQLKYKSLTAAIEKVNVPEIPFRALVHYKNFTDLYWPDFTVQEFQKALTEYANRQRRFGT